MFRLSDSEAKRAGLKVAKSSKYGVRQDSLGKLGRTIDGIRFDSQKEANRYCELKLLVKAGKICGLIADKKQLRWPLRVNDVLICEYEADFIYRAGLFEDSPRIVEDVKGCRTREYIMKKRLMKALLGIQIQEV